MAQFLLVFVGALGWKLRCVCRRRYCALLEEKGSSTGPEWSLWLLDDNSGFFLLTMTKDDFIEHKRFTLALFISRAS